MAGKKKVKVVSARTPHAFEAPEIRLVGSMEKAAQTPKAETPFRVAILGDFSGRANRGVCEPGDGIAKRRVWAVDRDTLDEVMARLGVEIRLPMAKKAPPLSLYFRELDDFHPDRLFDSSGRARAYRRHRRRLQLRPTACRRVRPGVGPLRHR